MTAVETGITPACSIDSVPLPRLGTGLSGENLDLGSEVGRNIDIDRGIERHYGSILVDSRYIEGLVRISTTTRGDVEYTRRTGSQNALGTVLPGSVHLYSPGR